MRTLAGFAEDAIKPYIPRIWDYFLDFLAIKCEAYQLRTNPDVSCPEESERSIKVSAAHADTVSILVECNEGSDYRIEFRNIDEGAVRWLPQSEGVSNQRQ